jgi:hypothetical protein
MGSSGGRFCYLPGDALALADVPTTPLDSMTTCGNPAHSGRCMGQAHRTQPLGRRIDGSAASALNAARPGTPHLRLVAAAGSRQLVTCREVV